MRALTFMDTSKYTKPKHISAFHLLNITMCEYNLYNYSTNIIIVHFLCIFCIPEFPVNI